MWPRAIQPVAKYSIRGMDCHSIDKDDVGPRHRAVVGRRAGSIAGYDYSKALKNSGLGMKRRWIVG